MRKSIWMGWGAALVLGLLAGCQNRAAIEAEVPVMIYLSAGALQCEPGSGRNLAQDEAALARAGITSRCAQVADDGQMRIQLCGSDSGRIHLFQIAAHDLAAAQGLGFQPLTQLASPPASVCAQP